MRENGQSYIGDEYAFRLGVFITNKRYIDEFNRKEGKTFKLGVNKFAAMTRDEYNSYLVKPHSARKINNAKEFVSKKNDIPKEFNWVEKGVVTPIRDQLQCGSGWCFAAAATQESIWAITHSDLHVLSTSDLLDCVYFCDGCNSGTPDLAYEYVISDQKGQWMLETDYPYQDYTTLDCKFDQNKAVTKTVNITVAHTEEDMAKMCAEVGPFSVEYDGSSYEFTYYTSGILDTDDCSPWGLCHSMTVVGYGTENNLDYWLVKNSFGTYWGISGYLKCARNKDGQCGISMSAISLIDE